MTIKDELTSGGEPPITLLDLAQQIAGGRNRTAATDFVLKHLAQGAHAGQFPLASEGSNFLTSTVSATTAQGLLEQWKHRREILATMSDSGRMADMITEAERLHGKLADAEAREIETADWTDDHFTILSVAFNQVASELVRIDPRFAGRDTKTPALFMGAIRAALARIPDANIQDILSKYNVEGVLGGMVSTYLDRPLQVAEDARRENEPTLKKGGRASK